MSRESYRISALGTSQAAIEVEGATMLDADPARRAAVEGGPGEGGARGPVYFPIRVGQVRSRPS